MRCRKCYNLVRDDRLGQCKYGLFLDVKKEDAAGVEGDFIAIVRTLK